ncbi:tripartite tricarboxylate transporter substrate binding protein [Corticibacterium sp. UT-5YL-CI-8]|nr:tripartite tricarboxylate transporter substrate binding protein [Tianweitania sp. UT-5YL-CI-8]
MVTTTRQSLPCGHKALSDALKFHGVHIWRTPVRPDFGRISVMSFKTVLRAGAVLAVSVLSATAAWAQEDPSKFPSKTITILAPFAPGGPADLFTRKQAEYLQAEYGVSFLVENVPGAGGIVAGKRLASGSTDGYTWFSASGGLLAIIPAVAEQSGFDPSKELELVGVIRSQPLMLAMRADAPYDTLADVVAAAKAKPGTLTYGSIGVNSALHLAGEMLCELAGIEMVHVPYKGSAEYSVDLLGGRLDFAISTPGTLNSHKGELKAVAQALAERSPMMPDVPTGAEAGVPGWIFDSWTGIVVKKGTPEALVTRIGEMIKTVNDNPKFREETAGMDASPKFISGADYKAELEAQIKKNAELIAKVAKK